MAPSLPGMSRLELAASDMWATGISPDSYPTEFIRTWLDERGIVPASGLLAVPDGDRVLVHGSTGGGALRHVAAGAPVTITVFALDGVVAAWNAFSSSANYRSAVLRGTLKQVPAEEAGDALRAVTDRLIPGRTDEVPPSTRKELAATVVLSLPLTAGSWLYKHREGPSSAPEDGSTDAWTGVVPLRLVAGDPTRDPWNDTDAPVPASVEELRARHR